MISSIDDMLERANEAHAAEREQAVRAAMQQRRQLENVHKKALKQAQRELDASHAEKLRMQHQFSQILDETQQKADSEVVAAREEAEEAKAAATAVQVQAAKAEELERWRDIDTLSGIAEKVLTDKEDIEKVKSIRSVDSIGQHGGACHHRMTDAAWVVGRCVLSTQSQHLNGSTYNARPKLVASNQSQFVPIYSV